MPNNLSMQQQTSLDGDTIQMHHQDSLAEMHIMAPKDTSIPVNIKGLKPTSITFVDVAIHSKGNGLASKRPSMNNNIDYI